MMAEPRSIEDLLQAGFFTTSRSKSPKPPPKATPPTLSREPSEVDREIPRTVAPLYNARPRTFTQSRRPPPPSVEDEETALSKEHGSSVASTVVEEEPPSRGDIDQNPIIMEVHEFNPERRFVLLSTADNQADDGNSVFDDKPAAEPPLLNTKIKPNGSYEANTGRKYDGEPPTAGGGLKPAMSERRRSRNDLPPLETNNLRPEDLHRRHSRAKSATYIEQQPGDYFSPQHSKRPSGESLLSPQVIKHATSGREKAYYDYSRSPNGTVNSQRSRSNMTDERRGDTGGRVAQSSSPTLKRGSSTFGSVGTPSRSFAERYDDGPRYGGDYAQPRLDRRATSPPRGERSRDSLSRRSSTYRRRGSSPRREESTSSNDYLQASRPSNYRRRKSIVTQGDGDFLLSPDASRPTGSGRSRSRAPPSPIPSPKVPSAISQEDFFSSSPRASTTFPMARDGRERANSAMYQEDEPQGRGIRPTVRSSEPMRTQPQPRGSGLNMAVPIVAAAGLGLAAGTAMPPSERRRVPPSSPPDEQPPIVLRPGSLEQEASWQPGTFDPLRDSLAVDHPMGSFRRYSEDANRGGLPEIPECPRKHGVAGMTDWLTLPRSDNFNICPECYKGVFLNSEFRHDFLPMPFKPRDREIACDFGSSPWYRIAWLLTIKARLPDLRLFHQIAAVNSTVGSISQPCPGQRKSTRVWYSIKNPAMESTIPEFTVCYECAKTIEVLLPNLTGVFVPLEAAAKPTRASCAMHFSADRKRFVLYFDTLETTSDKALLNKQAPNLSQLALEIERLSVTTECQEDRPVSDANWYVLQSLPELTVCGECFDEMVKPRLEARDAVARNFYVRPQRLPVATCQLYSPRMREIFRRACKRGDLQYLVDKVLERRQVEADIHGRLAALDQHRESDK